MKELQKREVIFGNDVFVAVVAKVNRIPSYRDFFLNFT